MHNMNPTLIQRVHSTFLTSLYSISWIILYVIDPHATVLFLKSSSQCTLYTVQYLLFHSEHCQTHIYVRREHLHENTHVGTERTRTHVEPREHVTVPQPLHWIKLLFFLLPSLWRGPIPLLFWGRQLVPSGVPCLSPLDVSCSGSLAKENNTHTLTQIPPHTHTTNRKAQWHL